MRALAGGLALLLVAAGLVRGEGAFLAAALPFAVFTALGAFCRPPQPTLEAGRRLSACLVPAGARVQVTVTVTNRGERLEALRLVDALPEGVQVAEGEPRWRGSLDPGAEAVIRYAVEGPRGRFRFERLEVEAVDPFTDLRTQASLSCPAALDAYPRHLPVGDLRFGPGAARPFSGRSRTRRTGTGTDFAGTRAYSPGDPPRHLNWRAEALWDQPLVNLFEEERAIDAGIILDCRSKAYGNPEYFELAVTAALSLAEDLLARGNRVAFLLYGDLLAWTPPGTGHDQRIRFRLAAAQARLGGHVAFERFDNLPVKVFPPRSLVLLVSPLRRQDVAQLRSLRARRYEVVVLRPDPLAREEGGTGPTAALAVRLLALEADVLLARLLRAGITVLDWHLAQPLTRCRVLPGALG